MALKTYHGSCHCGAVRFQADIDLSEGTSKCNCSICTKARSWFVIVKAPSFQLLAGDQAQAEYQWTPPGKPSPFLHYQFCNTCGIRTPGWGEHESFGGKFYFIPVASLDDADPDELAAAPVKYSDGRHDRFDQAPQDTRLLYSNFTG
jgi:hypothetical protein